MNRWKAAAFTALSGLALLAFCEAALRILYPVYADYNTEMWRYSARLKRLSREPELPFEHVPDRWGHFYGVEIRTNNAGWRSGRRAMPSKPPGVKRIAVIGDSQTLGWGVREENAFPAVLERRLREAGAGPVEVLNAGVGNYNLACEAVALEKALAHRPDLVVLALTINDAEIVGRVNPVLLFFMRHSYLYGFFWGRFIILRYKLGIAEPYDVYYPRLYRPGSAERAHFEASARRILELVKTAGVPLLVLDIPDLHGFADYPFSDITAFKRELFAEGAAFLDAHGSLARFEARRLWVSNEDPHPNAQAHAVLADALFREIEARRWLK